MKGCFKFISFFLLITFISSCAYLNGRNEDARQAEMLKSKQVPQTIPRAVPHHWWSTSDTYYLNHVINHVTGIRNQSMKRSHTLTRWVTGSHRYMEGMQEPVQRHQWWGQRYQTGHSHALTHWLTGNKSYVKGMQPVQRHQWWGQRYHTQRPLTHLLTGNNKYVQGMQAPAQPLQWPGQRYQGQRPYTLQKWLISFRDRLQNHRYQTQQTMIIPKDHLRCHVCQTHHKSMRHCCYTSHHKHTCHPKCHCLCHHKHCHCIHSTHKKQQMAQHKHQQIQQPKHQQKHAQSKSQHHHKAKPKVVVKTKVHKPLPPVYDVN